MVTRSPQCSGVFIQTLPEPQGSEKEKPSTSYVTLRMKKVTWSEDTVDNEHMNQRKSNICCIFHKTKLSPDDSDTSSCESCDEKGKNAYERPNHYNRKIK